MGKRALYDTTGLTELPPLLQKVVLHWSQPENWEKSLAQICKEIGVNDKSAYNLIARVTPQRFHQIRARVVDLMLARQHPAIMSALIKQAKRGNTKAIELYLKMTGRLDASIELRGALDLNFAQSLMEAKKRVQELEGMEETSGTEEEGDQSRDA